MMVCMRERLNDLQQYTQSHTPTSPQLLHTQHTQSNTQSIQKQTPTPIEQITHDLFCLIDHEMTNTNFDELHDVYADVNARAAMQRKEKVRFFEEFEWAMKAKRGCGVRRVADKEKEDEKENENEKEKENEILHGDGNDGGDGDGSGGDGLRVFWDLELAVALADTAFLREDLLSDVDVERSVWHAHN